MTSAASLFRTSALAAALAAFGAAHAADIKLGAAEALSGPAGQYGQSIKNGFDLAVEEINAAGGVKGNKLALQIEDEAGKKEQAIDVFKKLIFQDKVLMVFGPTLSNSAQAADPIAQAAKTVAFGTSNTADGITTIGDYVFRNSVTEADVLPETLRVAAKHAGVKKVAVLYGNDDVFTKSGYDAFKKALDDLKIPVTTTETFAKGDVDFKAQLTKIKASNPDAIVLSALIAEGAPIMVQARQLGITQPFIGGNGMNSVKVFDLAKGASMKEALDWNISGCCENRLPNRETNVTAGGGVNYGSITEMTFRDGRLKVLKDLQFGLRTGDLADAALQQVTHLGAEGAHGEPQLGLARDHVGRFTGQEGPHRNDARLQRRHVARDDGLQCHHDGRRSHHRVHRGLRHGAVATHATHLDDAGVATGHRIAGHRDELARRHARCVVHAKHGIARKQLEETIVQHALGAGQALFGRLKHQVQMAIEIARGREVPCGRQQHRGVAVVAAGVHLAEHLAGPGLAAGFGNRQGVHVGAQADVARARAHAQGAHHAGAAQAAVHLPAPAGQALGDQVAGGVFFIRQLGVGVDLLADGHHLGLEGTDGVEGGREQGGVHGRSLGVGDGGFCGALRCGVVTCAAAFSRQATSAPAPASSAPASAAPARR